MYGGTAYGRLAYGAEATAYTQAVALTGLALGTFQGGFGQVSTRGFIGWTKIAMPVPAVVNVTLTGQTSAAVVGVLAGNGSSRGFIGWTRLTLPAAQAGVLAGLNASFALGSMSVFSGTAVTLTGATVGTTLGTFVRSGSATLTGQQIGSAVGQMFAGDANFLLVNPPIPLISVNLVGSTVGSSIGVPGVVANGGTVVTLTGLAVGTALGTLVPPVQSVAVTLTGQASTFQPGSVVPVGSGGGVSSVTLTGHLVSTAFGALTTQISVPIVFAVNPLYLVYAPARVWTVLVLPE